MSFVILPREQIEAGRIQPGAWFVMQYGFDKRMFCIIRCANEVVLLENERWLYKRSTWMSVQEMFDACHRASFVGYGKRRPIMAWLREHLGVPFGTCYTKPKP